MNNSYLKSLVPGFLNQEQLDACWRILTETAQWQIYTTKVSVAGHDMESTFFRYRFNKQGYAFSELDEKTWFSSFDDWRSEYPKVFLQIIDAVQDHAGADFKIWRVGVNGVLQGQAGWIHHDSEHLLENSCTYLIYMNPYWSPLNAGHTSFYDKDLNEIFTVLPEPGKLVSYAGNLLHTGHAPTVANLFRVTMTVTGQYL